MPRESGRMLVFWELHGPLMTELDMNKPMNIQDRGMKTRLWFAPAWDKFEKRRTAVGCPSI